MKRILLASAALFFAHAAQAAVTANSIVTAQTPKSGSIQLTNGSVGPVAIYTAGANGSKCVGVFTTNSDTASETLTIDQFNGTTAHVLMTIATVITAGFVTGTPAQALITPVLVPGLPLDGNNNPFFYLNSGDTLRATASAVTSAKVINVWAECQDF